MCFVEIYLYTYKTLQVKLSPLPMYLESVIYIQRYKDCQYSPGSYNCGNSIYQCSYALSEYTCTTIGLYNWNFFHCVFIIPVSYPAFHSLTVLK